MGVLRKIKDLRNTDKNNIQLIKKSDFFDEDYYLNENPNIKMSPAKHYYYYGYKEGKSPSYKFSNDFYLNEHKDVQTSGMNPLVHYLRYGKMENRKIQKDNGASVEGLYYSFYNYNYALNIYLTDDNTNRINLFLDDKNVNIKQYKEIFKFVINYCIKYDFILRIIYSNFDLESLNDFICENKIELPKHIEYLFLKENNYLFVGKCDKYVCTSYKSVNALINSNVINTNIFLYMDDNECKFEDKYYVSKLAHHPNVICLCSNNIEINKYSFEFKIINKKIKKNIYYIADDLFLVGILWINRAINENIINNCKFNIVYNRKLNFHFDSDVDMKFENKSIVMDDNEIFKISSDNRENVNIIGKIKEEKSNIIIYNLDNVEIFNMKFNFKKFVDNDYINFINILKKFGD